MEINLTKDSFVDERTGEVTAPSEFLANLRDIEVGIQRIDVEINTLKLSLKGARDQREELVGRLRSCVREGKVLPLLEIADVDDPDIDGLDTKDD